MKRKARYKAKRAQKAQEDGPERRSSGMLRVPFVQRCRMEFDNGFATTGFLININVLGAYVAYENMPELGVGLICRFRTPGNDLELSINSVVAWINPVQQNPVHSLPPGFGIKFESMPEEGYQRIAELVRNYVKRHPTMRRRF
ncbi:MAG: PilZ domain-containing protein [Vicinamibacteria bacterium]|nr:PilZ domain-containing protein [Vicinamibacteria bacterium]